MKNIRELIHWWRLRYPSRNQRFAGGKIVRLSFPVMERMVTIMRHELCSELIDGMSIYVVAPTNRLKIDYRDVGAKFIRRGKYPPLDPEDYDDAIANNHCRQQFGRMLCLSQNRRHGDHMLEYSFGVAVLDSVGNPANVSTGVLRNLAFSTLMSLLCSMKNHLFLVRMPEVCVYDSEPNVIKVSGKMYAFDPTLHETELIAPMSTGSFGTISGDRVYAGHGQWMSINRAFLPGGRS